MKKIIALTLLCSAHYAQGFLRQARSFATRAVANYGSNSFASLEDAKKRIIEIDDVVHSIDDHIAKTHEPKSRAALVGVKQALLDEQYRITCALSGARAPWLMRVKTKN